MAKRKKLLKFAQRKYKIMTTREELIDRLIDLAFAEDIGDGDHTTRSTIPASEMGRQRLLVKEEGILAGVDIARRVFENGSVYRGRRPCEAG